MRMFLGTFLSLLGCNAFLGAVLLIGGSLTSNIAFAADEFPNRPTIGMNLNGMADWSPEQPLVDVFKLSRDWFPASGKFDVKTSSDGYPILADGQAVATLMLREFGPHYPAGKYVVTYQGRGDVQLKKYAVKKAISELPGRIEVDVQPADGGLQLEILKSDPSDPVRDIHVWMPGTEAAKSKFEPQFIETLRPFGAVRFMDWQRTNDSPVVKWSDRAKPGDARYSTAAGAPIELMIDAANTLQADPWFCLPHLCDDEFVRQFAKLVREKLDPKLRVYIEYSNEVWNFGFKQAHFAATRGKELKLSDNAYQAQLRFYSQRSVEIFKLWEQEFGGRRRLVRVMGSHSVNTWASEQVLAWRDANQQCDALAIAPYFGHQFGDPKHLENSLKISVDQLLDQLAQEVNGPNREVVRKQAELAKKHKLQLVAYEGGQHLVGHGGAEGNDELTKLLIAANRSPRMYDIYLAHLKHWQADGGGLFMVFSNVAKPSKWGSWGTREYTNQPLSEAHKFRAIVDFARQSK